MSNLVKGKNAITAMKVDGVYYPIFCAKSWELVLDQDEIEVTHINSGVSRDYIPGLNSGTISVTGITELDNSALHISVTYLMQQGIRRVIQDLRTVLTDDDGGTLEITYTAFVTSTTLGKQTGAYSNSAVTFRLTGTPAFSSTITPPVTPVCEVQPTLHLTLAEGDTAVVSATLIDPNAELLAVWREGLEFYVVTGTPVGRQVSFDKTTGTITFDAGNPGNPGGEGVEVMWQITA